MILVIVTPAAAAAHVWVVGGVGVVICVVQVMRFFVEVICVVWVRGEGVFGLIGDGDCAGGGGSGEGAGAAEVEESVDGEGGG